MALQFWMVSVFLMTLCIFSRAEYQVLRVGRIDGPDVGLYTHSVVLRDGTIFIVYYDEGETRLKGAHCLDPLCYHSTTIVLDEEYNYNCGRFVSMRLGYDDLPVMVYNRNYSLAVLKCLDMYCSTRHLQVIANDTARPPLLTGGYTALTLGIDTFPLIAYLDSVHMSLIVVHCLDTYCKRWTSHTIADGDHGRYKVGGYPAIDVLRDGRPVIAYHDFTRGRLMYILCNDPWCQEKSDNIKSITLDASSSDVGRYIALKVSPIDGYPTIMYTDEINGYLKCVHCSSPECLSSTPYIVDHIGRECYGVFPHLTISPSTGHAVLSYFNQTSATSGALKVAQATTLDCSSAFVQRISTGPCGYGRDSSIVFHPNGLVYISFLKYSPVAEKTLHLAILRVPNDTEIQGELLSSTRVSSPVVQPPSSISNLTDICGGD